MRPGSLASLIAPGASLLVDSSVVLAYLAGGESSSERAEELFDSMIATGRNPASISAVTVQEILVRPFQRGAAAIATAEGFLGHFTGLSVVDVGYDVAREGARIRAISGLRTPDALILASASIGRVDIFVTDDERLLVAATRVAPHLTVAALRKVAGPKRPSAPDD
jgi:predicted nucleic acid-binding protein